MTAALDPCPALTLHPLFSNRFAQERARITLLIMYSAAIQTKILSTMSVFPICLEVSPLSPSLRRPPSLLTCMNSAAFEGFNATILAYGQTGSGKTYTMGSSADMQIADESHGIIPRVIRNLFEMIQQREEEDPRSTYKVHVQFLEIYGEDIRDLLDMTRTSKVSIRETRAGEVFVTGAREEFVSSFEQMMKSLEDGTRNRTTAATKMNQTSSRSHAIFTVVLEHTIMSDLEATNAEVDDVVTQEVRKSKFHFVDLAGSERAKRTGAQGMQLKEGIDINKGLLALGNVISALGDETKKGKVFVPYRDSKLTRMLQDSLGGNSKTLMICCVSPAAINYNESMNALRYANRARNIKNKPVVNRDPTLIVIDELRSTLKAVATELLELRARQKCGEIDPRITAALLTELSSTTGHAGTRLFRSDSNMQESHAPRANEAPSNSNRPTSVPRNTTATSSLASATSSQEIKKLTSALQKSKQELADMQMKLTDSDFELKRQIEQLKISKQRASELSEQVLFARSERDFFHMRWAEACPLEAQQLDKQSGPENGVEHAILDNAPTGSAPESNNPALEEQKRFMRGVAKHLKEIEDLKQELAAERSRNPHSSSESQVAAPDVDHEFTSAMASLLSQARTQLQDECRKLKTIEEDHDEADSDDESIQRTEKTAELELEKAFAKRQKMLSSEVQELGQSIQLKEQLMEQLIKSQEQYSIMKAYYETKLSSLSETMKEKQAEREQLASELKEVSANSNDTMRSREAKLIEELNSKDEDIRSLQRKAEELKHLSQTQSRYTQQVAKLQNDIVDMKKQRVDLAKTLQADKKSHIMALNEKVKEIEALKRQLLKSNTEVRKLGRDKEIAENRVKDALREGAVLKKKVQDASKVTVAMPLAPTGEQSVGAAREAIKAITKSSARWGNKRVLSDQELRTKKWIDQRIAEISSREAAAESLRKQYEQQLELLTRRDALEKERSKAPSEEEALLELLEDRLSSIDGQLNVRSQRISDIFQQINEAGDVAGSDKTLDALKRMAAGTLPASHELIRLLMDMLVHANKSVKSTSDRLEEQQEKEKGLLHRLDDLQDKLLGQQHAHDKELTRLNHEYELKLQELFAHVSSMHDQQLRRSASSDNVSLMSPSSIEKKKTADPLELQLAISLQESMLMKSELQRETWKYAQLHTQYTELQKIKTALMRDLEDKNLQIRFLEEDRGIFKDMAEDLKNGLHALGKAGKTVIDNVKDRAQSKKSSAPSGLLSQFVNFSDDDDDTKSVMGEFESLGEEITRTGEVQATKDGAASSIYDRLYNPSSYTGSMKTVFDNDIESKRKRTQLIRKQEKSNVRKEMFVNTAAGGGTAGTAVQSKRSAEAAGKFFSTDPTGLSDADCADTDGGGGSTLQRKHSSIPIKSSRATPADGDLDESLTLDLPPLPYGDKRFRGAATAPKADLRRAHRLRSADDPLPPPTPTSSGAPGSRGSSPPRTSSPALSTVSAPEPGHIWSLHPLSVTMMKDKSRIRSPKTSLGGTTASKIPSSNTSSPSSLSVAPSFSTDGQEDTGPPSSASP